MPNLLIFLTFSKFVTLWPWPWDENEKSSSVGLCRCHWANQIPKLLPDSTNPLGEDVTWNRLPPKNTFFGRGSTHNGRTTPILRKTQLDHDINLPPKFYQDRIKTHGAMLGTDRQTDRQTHTPITNIVVTYFFVNQLLSESAYWTQLQQLLGHGNHQSDQTNSRCNYPPWSHCNPVSEPQRVLQYRCPNAWAQMITETGDHHLLEIGHSRHPPEGTASG